MLSWYEPYSHRRATKPALHEKAKLERWTLRLWVFGMPDYGV
jgi:hypothetical protein